jgi:MFS family permease
MRAAPPPAFGLWANRQQFALLLLVNAFVGAMLGLERTVVPLLAAREFGLASVSVTLSFILSFGVVKALANLYAGRRADAIGRKPLLVAGWVLGLPVPLIVMLAPAWGWIVAANILLGLQQGLCWSSAVIMKIDLVGPVQRGLATGLNEFTGYLAMAATTVASGWIAQAYALRPQPFYLGLVFAGLGLLISALFIHDTHAHAQHEAGPQATPPLSFGAVWRRVSWQDRTFFSLCQGGLVNNLNDVVIWGLLPLLALQNGLATRQAAAIGAAYLAVWGTSQLATGPLSDRLGRKPLIIAGLWLQAAAIAGFALSTRVAGWWVASIIMGLGTGMVYPTLLAAIADAAPPTWRASALGVYRLWRDSGYAAGALVAGGVADVWNVRVAVVVIAGLTLAAGALAAGGLRETHPG